MRFILLRSYIVSLLTLSVAPTMLAANPGQPTVSLLSQQGQSVTLEVKPAKWNVRTVETARGELTTIDFAGAVWDEVAGQPQIPYAVTVVGAPAGARVQATVLEVERETMDGVLLMPFSPGRRKDGTAMELVFDSKTYNSTASFPANIVAVDPPSQYRDQRIVRVRIAGALFEPAQKRVVRLKRVVVRLDFVGGKTAAQPSFAARSQTEEETYDNLLLNYQQAKSWRVPRPAMNSLRKSSLQQNSTNYRFSIQEEGIYRIDGRTLEANISGLNLSTIDPDQIRLFNNGGREVPRNPDDPRPAGLVENAIIVDDGGDGSFDRDDSIIFYGKGVSGWDYDIQDGGFSHYINHYGFSNLYWLSLNSGDAGKRMASVASLSPVPQITESYAGLAVIEEEKNNRLRSGLNWFGQGFAVDEFSRSHTWSLAMPNAVPAEEAQFKFRFAALNQGSHRFTARMNNNTVGSTTFTGLLGDFSGDFLRIKMTDQAFVLANALVAGDNTLELAYAHSSTFGQAFLDWVEVIYTARLQAIDNALLFTVSPASGSQTYRVNGFTDSSLRLFDVTDFSAVTEITGTSISAGTLVFTDVQQATAPKRYACLSPQQFKSIDSFEIHEFLDLRDPGLDDTDPGELVIITHNDFFSQAERLESYRENSSPTNQLPTRVVRVNDIYDNFSGGLVDPGAIRDFLKFAFETWQIPPMYVVLFGDGSYDYKNSNVNFIPTYQTDELGDANRTVLGELESRTTDSWYTYVTRENDVPGNSVMDMAIGRLNSRTIVDAKNAIDKIIAYETQSARGIWRNTVTVVGDDELVGGGRPSAQDAGLHIPQAERLSENSVPPRFNVQKIFLSEFPKVVSAAVGGFTKPAAKEALLRQMNQGSLIVNYVGHGNSSLWAHERIFEKADNDLVQNQGKLIFFVAATCDWALFDDPIAQSQAEELLLVEDRGAIAMVSSTRLVFSSTNFGFNTRYYNNLFKEAGRTMRIGDAFIQARIQNNNRTNDEKYHIYGDPTLRLAVPQMEAVITSMTPDSVIALSTVEIVGEIQQDSSLVSDFNGTAFVNTFDSRKFVEHQPEAGGVQRYFLPGNSIYRGTVPVQNGKFKARFIVPKDISYGGRQARVSTYFWNDEVDGAGFRDDINVSSSTSNLVDGQGPEVKIFFREHENFNTGDIVEENVTLVVELADTVSGINIAGEIGHRLTLNIDPNDETCLSQLQRSQGTDIIDLTDLFQFDEGDHVRGRIEFPMNFPEEVDIAGRTISCLSFDGEQRHTLVVKAWDNSNNSSTASAEVLVVHEQGLVLREVMNYPNPFRDRTTFTFFSSQDSEVEIRIYTVAGQLIQTVEYPAARNGFNMVDWDGRDAQGDAPANGVYLYKLIAKAQGANGVSQKEIVGRLAIIR